MKRTRSNVIPVKRVKIFPQKSSYPKASPSIKPTNSISHIVLKKNEETGLQVHLGKTKAERRKNVKQAKGQLSSSESA